MARNDTFFKRLTDLFKSGPAIRRRVKGIDPGSYYDTKLIQGNYGYRAPAPFGFGRENSPFSVLGSYGLLDRMSRYCITGDMLIPTNTEKGLISVNELVEIYKKPNHEKYYTFSYCHETDEIVLKEIQDAFLTKQDKIVEVHFDNNAVLKCTKDHKIMLRDGSYKEAQHLKENDTVMPFYRKELTDINEQLKTSNLNLTNKYKNNKNNKVKKVVFTDNVENVYDLTIEDTHNFAVIDPKTAQPCGIIHNSEFSEMEFNAELGSALDIYCLSGDVEIPLLDDNTKTIKQLFDNNEEKFWVYSYNIKENKFVPGLCNKVIKTGINQQLYKINFDDGSFIKLTENHLVLLTDNSYIRVKALKEDLLIKSFYKNSTTSTENHKIISIEKCNDLEDVYDLQVEEHHNFAAGMNGGYVIVHNSDETVGGSGQDGHCLHVYSDNINIKKHLDELFFDVLNVEFNLRPWARNLVKFGDFLLYVEVLPEVGVINAQPIPVNEVEREEGFDENDPYAVRFKWLTRGNVYLENWQVVHMRILGNDLFLPYGTSILEPARRVWRQLCISADQFIWTRDGYKSIKDITNNDIVYCYDYKNNHLKSTKVVACKSMGEQKIVKVKTRHRVLNVTPNHGLLVKNKNGQFEYKKAEDLLHLNEHRSEFVDKLVLPYINNGTKDFNLELDYKNYMVKLVNSCEYNSINIMKQIEDLDCEYSSKDIHSFLRSKKRIPYKDFIKVKQKFNILNENTKFYFVGSKYESILNELQFTVTKEFCKFFGFMLGDGWITNKRDRIGFALGEYEEQNKYYINLLEKFFNRKATITPANKKCGGQVNITSKEAVVILETLGFKTGFINKRMPSWVYKLHPEYKIEFLKGYHDADGSSNDGRISSSNQDLLEDTRILAQQCGVTVGQVLLDREEGKYFDKSFNKEINRKSSYRLYLDLNNINKETQYENVISVEEIKENETYDLQVEDEAHNFICEGIVSHNTMLEDAMLVYRVVRSPERRVFYIDVANIAPNDIPSYMEAAKSTLKSQSVIEKGSGRQDFRYNPLPVAWDTPIPLLDGRITSIKDLAIEYEKGKQNWVYSLQDKTNKIVPGKIIWCGKNYTANKLIKVWFNDGTYIKTAPEHPFVLRDGTSKSADKLKVGENIMPLYISAPQTNKKYSGYPRVYDPYTKSYKPLHRIVADEVLQGNKNIVHENTDWSKNKFLVVHHKDFNKNNSEPSNLQWIGDYDHNSYHSKLGKICKYNGTELHKSHNVIRSTTQKENWTRNKISRSTAFTWNIPEKCFDIAYREILSNKPKMSRDEFYLNFKLNKTIKDIIIKHNSGFNRNLNKLSRTPIERKMKELGYSGYSDFKENYVGYKNHTISKIEEVYENCDVYCMTVVGPNGEEDRHNFAAQNIDLNQTTNSKSIQSGKSFIFVRNSVSDDYYIPVRGTQSGTKIDTLQGGQHATAIEDVQYMQSKLFAAIKVPKPYLNYDENLSSKSSLSQMDIRFSRTITNIQKIIISELNKLAMIHLFAKGFDGEDLVDFEIKLSNPSSVAVQQKLELWATKADVAGTLKDVGLVDEKWIQKNVLELTEDDIVNINKGLYEDKVKEVQLDTIVFDTEQEQNTTTDTFSPTNYNMNANNPAPKTSSSSSSNNNNINKNNVILPNDDKDNPYKINYQKGSTPIRATPFLTRHKKNRKRRVGSVNSKDNTSMSDMSSILSPSNRFFKDVYDMRTLRNPTSENVEKSTTIRLEPILPNDVKSMLKNLKDHFNRNYQSSSSNKKLLSEDVEINLNDYDNEEENDIKLDLAIEEDKVEKNSLKDVIKEIDNDETELDIE